MFFALLGCHAPPSPEEPEADTASAASGGDVEAAITVGFDGDARSYEGPTTIPAGMVNVNARITRELREGYALGIATLDEGKTFEDLDAWPSTDQPPWLDLHAFRDTPEGDPDDLLPFSFYANEAKSPFLVVCFTREPEAKVGFFGPVEVED